MRWTCRRFGRPRDACGLHLSDGWHRLGEGGRRTCRHVQRGYWVALSEYAGVVWIYQEGLAGDETAWYLHGIEAK